MFDALAALSSLIVHAVLESLMWFAKVIGAQTLKLLPLRQQTKQDESAIKAFILGSLLILVSIAMAWWFLVG